MRQIQGRDAELERELEEHGTPAKARSGRQVPGGVNSKASGKKKPAAKRRRNGNGNDSGSSNGNGNGHPSKSRKTGGQGAQLAEFSESAESAESAESSTRRDCGHYPSCNSRSRETCTRSHDWPRDHDTKVVHAHCSLDFFTPPCPAYLAVRESYRPHFKADMMVCLGSSQKWLPHQPPNSQLTAEEDLVKPECRKVGERCGQGQSNKAKQPVLDEAIRRWNVERESLVKSGVSTAPPSKQQQQGGAGGGQSPPYRSSSPHTLRSLPRYYSPSSSSSSSSSADEHRAAPLTKGAVQTLLPTRSHQRAAVDVVPILYHERVVEYFKHAITGRIVLFRLDTSDRPSNADFHMRPTRTDIDNPQDNNALWSFYRRCPFKLMYDSETPLPDPSPIERVERDRLQRLDEKTPAERVTYFCRSLNSNTFSVEAGRQLLRYCMDNWATMWATITSPPANQLGPTLTYDEYKERLREKNANKRREQSLLVFTRTNALDERTGEERTEEHHRALVNKLILYLTTDPNLAIYDINIEYEEKEHDEDNKAVRKRNRQRAKRRQQQQQQRLQEGEDEQEEVSENEAEVVATAAQTLRWKNNNKLGEGKKRSRALSLEINRQRWKLVAALHTAHPVNLSRIPHYYQSLTSLMPDHGLTFLGGHTLMSYLKFSGNGEFALHFEQGFFPFVNYCQRGVGVWWSIPPGEENERKLVQYSNYIGHHSDLPVFDADTNLTRLYDTHPGLALVFVRSRMLLPDPHELAADFNIPVERFDQEEGDVMIGHGYVMHMGTAGTGQVLTEAINAVPIWWLDHGLPELVDMLIKHISPYMQQWRLYWAYGADNYDLPSGLTLDTCSLLFRKQTASEYTRVIPVSWFRLFTRILLHHLQVYCNDTDSDAVTNAAKVGTDFTGWDHLTFTGLERLKRLWQWLQSPEARDIEMLQSEEEFEWDDEEYDAQLAFDTVQQEAEAEAEEQDEVEEMNTSSPNLGNSANSRLNPHDSEDE